MELELNQETLAYLGTLPVATRQKLYAELGRREWQKCADNVLYWLDPAQHAIPYVYTRDPKPLYKCNTCGDGLAYYFDRQHLHLTMAHGIELPDDDMTIYTYFTELPTTRAFTMFPYIEPLVRTWMREKIVLIEKSRDMMATWLIVALYTWDTIFHNNRENIFQSDDTSKALDLVERAYFVAQNQPSFIRDIHPVRFSAGVTRAGVLQVPSLKSVIYGFPDGPDQIRQFHPSGLFQDEAAFQPEAESAFSAAKPAIQAGGRFTAISSANPSWFYRMCRDQTA